jgi:uncharacterized membrane protein
MSIWESEKLSFRFENWTPIWNLKKDIDLRYRCLWRRNRTWIWGLDVDLSLTYIPILFCNHVILRSFILSVQSFLWKWICAVFSLFVCLYLYCRISDWESWDPINQFNPVTYLCLSQAGFAFQIPYVVVFIFVFGGLRWVVVVHFVDIGGIVHHHCLNCLFIICILEICE